MFIQTRKGVVDSRGKLIDQSLVNGKSRNYPAGFVDVGNGFSVAVKGFHRAVDDGDICPLLDWELGHCGYTMVPVFRGK